MNTVSTGKASKPRGKKQLNAALSEQLVLDFNAAATAQGRDALLEDLIVRFLEKVRPESPSVLQFRGTQKAEMEVTTEMAAKLDEIIGERRALYVLRDRAEEMVTVSTAALMRRAPKRARSERKCGKKQQVS